MIYKTEEDPCFGFFNWPSRVIHQFIRLCLKNSTRFRPNCKKLRTVYEIEEFVLKKGKIRVKKTPREPGMNNFQYVLCIQYFRKLGMNTLLCV
jgi:hypothetical protein